MNIHDTCSIFQSSAILRFPLADVVVTDDGVVVGRTGFRRGNADPRTVGAAGGRGGGGSGLGGGRRRRRWGSLPRLAVCIVGKLSFLLQANIVPMDRASCTKTGLDPAGWVMLTRYFKAKIKNPLQSKWLEIVVSFDVSCEASVTLMTSLHYAVEEKKLTSGSLQYTQNRQLGRCDF